MDNSFGFAEFCSKNCSCCSHPKPSCLLPRLCRTMSCVDVVPNHETSVVNKGIELMMIQVDPGQAGWRKFPGLRSVTL